MAKTAIASLFLVICGAGCGGHHASARKIIVRPAAFDRAADRAEIRRDKQLVLIEQRLRRLNRAQVMQFVRPEQLFRARHGRYSVHLLADFGLNDKIFKARDISTDGQKLIVDVSPVETQAMARLEEQMDAPTRFVFDRKRYFLDNGYRKYIQPAGVMPTVRAVLDHGKLQLQSSGT